MNGCEAARERVGAARDQNALPDPRIDEHIDRCAPCRSWLATVDDVTRALTLRTVTPPNFVDRALELWDARPDDARSERRTAGRILLGIAALGCLVVGLLIAADSAGHTHIGVTAHREVLILEVALGFGLACAAWRPGVFLAGILPVIGIVAAVNLAVSALNVASGNSSLAAEIAHVPFVVGLLGALLVHRSEPVFAVDSPTRAPVASA